MNYIKGKKWHSLKIYKELIANFLLSLCLQYKGGQRSAYNTNICTRKRNVGQKTAKFRQEN